MASTGYSYNCKTQEMLILPSHCLSRSLADDLQRRPQPGDGGGNDPRSQRLHHGRRGRTVQRCLQGQLMLVVAPSLILGADAFHYLHTETVPQPAMIRLRKDCSTSSERSVSSILLLPWAALVSEKRCAPDQVLKALTRRNPVSLGWLSELLLLVSVQCASS